MFVASTLFANEESQSVLRLRHIAGAIRSVNRYLKLKLTASILQRVSDLTAS